MTVHILGVRHHSPACARLVHHVITTVRPATVLVEGPLDFNPRLPELLLPHTLPVALFTWAPDRRSSWLPLSDSSPELVALRAAQEVGAEARLCDLPAWHPAFEGRSRLDEDGGDALSRAWVDTLRERWQLDDEDALWDHLFELPLTYDALRARLEAWFLRLRDGRPAGPRDAPRELAMAQALAWAAPRGDVVLVCGGWHAPALEGWRDLPPVFPTVQTPPDAGAWIVPFSDQRLDSFAGYAAGMPMSGWQARAWAEGPDAVGEAALAHVVGWLRERGHPVSTADQIALHTTADALRRLRGHAALARVDVLDAITSVLVRDALPAPAPWTRRGPLPADTHPVLVEVARALAGERLGRLAPETPRPPLLHDVARLLDAHGLAPGALPRTLALRGEDPRAVVLHRLRVLGAPGFELRRRPTPVEPDERWQLSQHPDLDARLIEASGWGGTLEEAAQALLVDRLQRAQGDMAAVAAALDDAVRAQLSVQLALGALAATVAQERSLAALGAGLRAVHDLQREFAQRRGSRRGEGVREAVDAALRAAFDRGLWLVEGRTGPAAPADAGEIAAVRALRDVARAAPSPHADAVMGRVAWAPEAPPALRGAALGWAWSLGRDVAGDAAALATALPPTRLGDWLAGLLALARGAAAASGPLVAAVDRVTATLPPDELLIALPSLRLAFSWLSPEERYAVALAAAALHGRGEGAAVALLRPGADPLTVARGAALDAAVEAVAQRWGLA